MNISSHNHTFGPTWTSATYEYGNHSHQITTSYPSWNDLDAFRQRLEELPKQEKEKPMTTLEKVRAERKEAMERQRIERMYQEYDDNQMDDFEDGVVLRFVWQGKNHPYTYACLFVGDKWYVTGREAPNGLATEDFVAWLIGKDVAFADLQVLA